MAGDRSLKLNPKQKRYCRERAAGKNRGEAYVAAGYSDKDATASAYRLEHFMKCSEKIRAEIDRLTAAADKGAILDRKARQALLTEMALDTEEKTDNRLRATDMLNRMSGDYTDRVEQTYSGSLNLSYEERRKMLMEGLEKDA